MRCSLSESASAHRTRVVIFAVSLTRWPHLRTGVKAALSKSKLAKQLHRENDKHTPGAFAVSEDMLERMNVGGNVSNC